MLTGLRTLSTSLLRPRLPQTDFSPPRGSRLTAILNARKIVLLVADSSVADPDPNLDPDPPDPGVFGPPGSGSGSTSQRYGFGSGSCS
jgi:hypothetical protein